MRTPALFLALLAAGCGGGTNTGGDGGDGGGPTGDLTMAAADSGCMAGQKSCAGLCVNADPAAGCNLASCTPCPAGTNQVAICTGGACAATCNVGFGDCDGNAANGCEKDVTTDPANCGSCGFACANGAKCVAGACQLTPPMPNAVGDLACVAITANEVVWTTAKTPGEVWSVPKAGGNPTQIAANQMRPRGIATDATNIYWTNIAGGSVVKCALAGCGGMPTVLASGQMNPFQVAVDGTNAYWTNSSGGTVMKCAIAGCNNAPAMIASGQKNPNDITTDGKNVYWTNGGDGTVMQAPVGGGNPVQLASMGPNGARGIAVDATSVYFTHGAGTVNRVPIGGGAVVALASGQSSPWGVTVDATHAYWTTSGMAMNAGKVSKAPVGGGTVVVRAAMQNYPICIANDATTLYWINEGGGSIQKVAK